MILWWTRGSISFNLNSRNSEIKLSQGSKPLELEAQSLKIDWCCEKVKRTFDELWHACAIVDSPKT